MPDNGGVTDQRAQAPATGKKKRGRESTGDMVRSLSLVLVIVGVVFFLAQPPKSDEQVLRVVDPTGDVRSWGEAHPTVPVPGTVPTGWRATVADSTRDQLRVGWVTPAGTYVEYAASTAEPERFVQDITAQAPPGDPVDVSGTTWQSYREGKSTSLVLSVPGATVVVGTLRANASLADLRLLAGSLAPLGA